MVRSIRGQGNATVHPANMEAPVTRKQTLICPASTNRVRVSISFVYFVMARLALSNKPLRPSFCLRNEDQPPVPGVETSFQRTVFQLEQVLSRQPSVFLAGNPAWTPWEACVTETNECSPIGYSRRRSNFYGDVDLTKLPVFGDWTTPCYLPITCVGRDEMKSD